MSGPDVPTRTSFPGVPTMAPAGGVARQGSGGGSSATAVLANGASRSSAAPAADAVAVLMRMRHLRRAPGDAGSPRAPKDEHLDDRADPRLGHPDCEIVATRAPR